jgi:NAD(P)-dependent dehydrogenase (short-subunit alcohol dehydrogenase family)
MEFIRENVKQFREIDKPVNRRTTTFVGIKQYHMENTPQQGINSGFSAASTAEEVIKNIDLTGKVAIVTGGYSGIGLETARVLRAAGATVIIPARDMKKAERNTAGLEVELEQLDLFDPTSIDTFAAKFIASGRPLHILINSAGIMASPLVRDSRGYESQFATNHLGHFQLTARLWPALQKANGARVVAVSSWGHRLSPIVFEDVNYEHRDYNRMTAYGQSKTANVLFAVQLDQLGKDQDIRGFAVHPGTIVSTDLSRNFSAEDLRSFGVIDEEGQPVLDPDNQLKTVEQGAATSIWFATNPQLNGMGGVYGENCDISPLVNPNQSIEMKPGYRPVGVLPYAVDPDAAQRLWQLSEELTGVTFNQ